ncbi:AraC family transcriptional regulator [uncultured Aquitalea sp.]|uniref:AraC family transcriptional regulator n=1 Tax=uncultured Aquitalea sp. TaxID=540272 RepID=UPI0025E4D9D9|nr:AraC family transcriptional regulator [uncultured Aquitalea sp.]
MASREYARFFRADDLAPLECLDAFYHSQTFAPHFHEEYVVNALTTGAQSYRHRGGQHVAGVGALVLINPGEVHTGECAHQQGWAYRGFYPAASLMTGLAEDISGRRGAIPFFRQTVVQDPQLALELDRLHCLLRDSADALLRESALQAVFASVVQRHMQVREREAASARPGIERARQLLSDRLADNLSLQALAAEAGLSPWQFNRQFARQFGLPPVAWRNQLRIARGRQLLGLGRSAGTVAQELGFADQAHFTRAFRRSLGVTPAAYQRGLASKAQYRSS